MFVGHDEKALYTLEASPMWNLKPPFHLLHVFFCKVLAVLRALSKNILEDICTLSLFSGLYSVAANNE